MAPFNIKRSIQVNMPFAMLVDSYLEIFIREGLNPEIGLDAAVLDGYTEQEFEEAAKKLREGGLGCTFHAPFVDLSAGSTDPEIRGVAIKRLKQVAELIPLFKPKTVVCHAGYDWKRYEYLGDTWVKNSIDTWSLLAERIKTAGSRLVLENVYERGPGEMVDLFEGLGDQGVGFCLDAGHQSAFSETSLATWLDLLGPYLQQLHLHDNFGARDEHLAMGKGSIDFLSFFEKLESTCEEAPVVTIEPHRDEDLQPSLEYLERFWPWK